MSSLLDLVTRSLDRNAMNGLASQIGAPAEQTAGAVQVAVPLLFGALQRNASTPYGAAALAGAIDRNHDGSVLDDLAGFFGKPATGADERSVNHIFGDRRDSVQEALSRASGLGGAQIGQLLAQLAPFVLGALARARQSAPESAGATEPGGELGSLLGNAMGQLHRTNTGLGGLLGGLLDANGDGSVVDDLLGRAMGGSNTAGGGLGGLLGGLLGGRRS